MDIFNVDFGYLVYYDVHIFGGFKCTCKEIYIIQKEKRKNEDENGNRV